MTTSWVGWPEEGTFDRSRLNALYWVDDEEPIAKGWYWEPTVNSGGQVRLADLRGDKTLRVQRFAEEWKNWRRRVGATLAARKKRTRLLTTKAEYEGEYERLLFQESRRIALWFPAA